MIRIENVSKIYHLDSTAVEALNAVSLTINAGEFLAITGPSGSGKTTLLNLIGCIEKPTTGTIQIDDIEVTKLNSDESAHLRALKIGYIFQTFNLLPILTAAENVEYPLFLREMNGQERKKRVAAALKEVGLESHAAHKPRELSGGQRQRVAIARALVGSPSLILADEPTANLDHKTGTEILQLMKELNRKTSTTFIFSTHDPKVMDQARRQVVLADGRLVDGR